MNWKLRKQVLEIVELLLENGKKFRLSENQQHVDYRGEDSSMSYVDHVDDAKETRHRHTQKAYWDFKKYE